MLTLWSRPVASLIVTVAFLSPLPSEVMTLPAISAPTAGVGVGSGIGVGVGVGSGVGVGVRAGVWAAPNIE